MFKSTILTRQKADSLGLRNYAPAYYDTWKSCDRANGLMLEFEGDFVGFVLLDYDRKHEKTHEPLQWIDYIYIVPEHRRKGIGSKLVYMAMHLAPKDKDYVMTCCPLEDEFFEKLGFSGFPLEYNNPRCGDIRCIQSRLFLDETLRA